MVDEPALPQAIRWIGIVGMIVAPTTLITSLCYYFGYVSTRKHLLYLGIDPDALGYSSSDYVTKSIGVMYALSVALLAVSVAVLLVCAGIRRLVAAGRFIGAIHNVGAVAIVVGALAALLGVLFVLRPGWLHPAKPWLASLALGVGSALVLFGSWTLRASSTSRQPLAAVERSLLFVAVVVVVVAAFWVVNIFAEMTGEIDGQNDVGKLWSSETNVLLDTKERLFLPKELVKEEPPLPSSDPEGGQTFRYQCFRAIVIRGERWVLVPGKWTPEFGYVMITTASPSTRITVRRLTNIPEETGQEPNVRRYWPCPEAVPRATGSIVAGMLLDPEYVNRILDGATLVSERRYTAGPRDDPRSNSCAGAADSSAEAGNRERGFVVAHVHQMTEPAGAHQRHWIQEDAVEFETPAQAGEFVKQMRQAWAHCGQTTLKITYPGGRQEQRMFGDARYLDDADILVITSSVAGDQPRKCAHAVAAKSNVVVDVQLCGPTPPTQAAALVDAIRNNFPLE